MIKPTQPHSPTHEHVYIHQPLSIWLGIQFRQHNGQKNTESKTFFFLYFWLGMTFLDPRGPGMYSKFLQSPLMIDFNMNGRVLDFDDISIIFMKLKKESCSI